jgi:hypothetical protein
MPVEALVELTLVFSEDLGQQDSSRFIDKIKSYSGDKFQRAVCNTNRLFISFEGHEELTPFILSLVKRVSEMGREEKIGVRDYYLPSYELSFDCEHIGKLEVPFTKGVICNGKACKVIFNDIEKDFLRRGSIGRIMSLIQSKTKEKTWKVLYKSDVPAKGLLNPFEEIEKKDMAKKGLAKNEYFYLPRGMKEISGIKTAILETLNKNFRLEEFFPLSHTPFALLESEDIIEIAPPEIFNYFFGEFENSPQAYESYVITGSVKSMAGKPKGVIFDEIPFNLYKALEKRKMTTHYFYAQKNMKILITFFEEDENYLLAAKNITDELKTIFKSLSYRIISRIINGEVIRFEAVLPYNKSWIPIAEAMFSNEAYTKPFKIDGKSGQVNINLENIFLAQVAQGIISVNADEAVIGEEVPTDKKSFQEKDLLE